VPILAGGEETGLASDYLTRRRKTEGRFDERVETIDQSIESD